MKRIVWSLIITLVAFTVTVLFFNYNGKEVQPELITGFIVAVTGELATMGGIKVFKVRHEPRAENDLCSGSDSDFEE